MILYFSATGNSEYVAQRIGNEIGDEVVNLFEKIKTRDESAMESACPWVIVAPTYAWRIPRILEKWLKNADLKGSREIYFVMTCGGSIGNAGKYLRKFCAEKQLRYRGCFAVTMPENYIALFQTPGAEEAARIINAAESIIDNAADLIANGEDFPQPHISVGDKLSSGIVNDVFYPLFVSAKKFYVTENCVGCGKCVKVCPLENVRLVNKKPVWDDHCTHCMACICRCPEEAVEYGKHSMGLPRYVCTKKI